MDFYSTKRVKAFLDGNIQVGPGMKLVYQDGYESWCPLPIFERDYQPITAMSFGHAIAALKAGERVARAGWNGKGMWLKLVEPHEYNMTGFHMLGYVKLPFIAMRTADASIVPWLASQTDMLVDDWQVVT